jgi:hypothetical protein
MERTARPCRPPLLTLVCKRGGRPPSAFRLLPRGATGAPPEACSPARCDRVGLPILIVLDQNRWTGACVADTLRSYLTAKNGRGDGNYARVVPAGLAPGFVPPCAPSNPPFPKARWAPRHSRSRATCSPSQPRPVIFRLSGPRASTLYQRCGAADGVHRSPKWRSAKLRLHSVKILCYHRDGDRNPSLKCLNSNQRSQKSTE